MLGAPRESIIYISRSFAPNNSKLTDNNSYFEFS